MIFKWKMKGMVFVRDPNRINKFCDQLKAYWHMVPDWRFMQLICNLQRAIGNDGFYLEDDEMLDVLSQYFEDVE